MDRFHVFACWLPLGVCLPCLLRRFIVWIWLRNGGGGGGGQKTFSIRCEWMFYEQKICLRLNHSTRWQIPGNGPHPQPMRQRDSILFRESKSPASFREGRPSIQAQKKYTSLTSMHTISMWVCRVLFLVCRCKLNKREEKANGTYSFMVQLFGAFIQAIPISTVPNGSWVDMCTSTTSDRW